MFDKGKWWGAKDSFLGKINLASSSCNLCSVEGRWEGVQLNFLVSNLEKVWKIVRNSMILSYKSCSQNQK